MFAVFARVLWLLFCIGRYVFFLRVTYLLLVFPIKAFLNRMCCCSYVCALITKGLGDFRSSNGLTLFDVESLIVKIDCRKDEGWIPFKNGRKSWQNLRAVWHWRISVGARGAIESKFTGLLCQNTLSSRFVRKFCEFLSISELFQSIFVFLSGYHLRVQKYYAFSAVRLPRLVLTLCKLVKTSRHIILI